MQGLPLFIGLQGISYAVKEEFTTDKTAMRCGGSQAAQSGL